MKKNQESESCCDYPCTDVVELLTDHEVAANIGTSVPPYTKIDGFRYINLYVEFTQKKPEEEPVDLGVTFAFDEQGTMSARHYVNLEENLSGPQSTNFISVSGQDAFHGTQWGVSRYMVRLPVMGPFIQVFVYNRADQARKVNVWGYLVG